MPPQELFKIFKNTFVLIFLTKRILKPYNFATKRCKFILLKNFKVLKYNDKIKK